MSDSTLRDKLVQFWYAAYRAGQHNDDGPELEAVDALEALCQEVAREARLDEWLRYHRFQNSLLDDGTAGYQIKKYEERRIAELTQKPAEETEGQDG